MSGLQIRIDHFKQGDFEMGPINLDLPKACVMGLIGENGAGKTTLINLITRRIHTGADWIQFDGSYEYRETMAFILDEIPFANSYKVKDVGKLMSYAYQNWDAHKFETYCQSYGLDPKQKVKTLSLGMGQRLMQAAALSHQAKLFVFDEPNDGIDPFIRSDLLNDLRNSIYDDEATVMISSHNVNELEEIVDYIAYMEDGKVLFSLDIEAFKDQAMDLLNQFYVSKEGMHRYEKEPSLALFTALMQTERRR